MTTIRCANVGLEMGAINELKSYDLLLVAISIIRELMVGQLHFNFNFCYQMYMEKLNIGSLNPCKAISADRPRYVLHEICFTTGMVKDLLKGSTSVDLS